MQAIQVPQHAANHLCHHRAKTGLSKLYDMHSIGEVLWYRLLEHAVLNLVMLVVQLCELHSSTSILAHRAEQI